MIIFFLKSHQIDLFDAPVPIKAHSTKTGGYVRAHTRIMKVSAKTPKQQKPMDLDFENVANLINNMHNTPDNQQKTGEKKMNYEKYAEMLRNGVSEEEIGKQMKADGLDVPSRGKAWSAIRPAKEVPAKKAISKKTSNPQRSDNKEKFLAAANSLLQIHKQSFSSPLLYKKLTDNEASFVNDIVRRNKPLTIKQKQWLKKICDKFNISLDYKPKVDAFAQQQSDSRRVYGNPDHAPDWMDIPVWNEKGKFWYDAEY